jgi:hypothetical protein
VGSLALLSLLMLTIALGGVCHLRRDSCDTNCSICHLIHQSIEHPLASHREPALNLIALRPDSPEPRLVSNPEPHRLPARAPPSA